MKTLNAFAFALLFAAGCSTYPENQSTYSTSSYSTPPTSSGAQVISSPTYDTTTATQGAAATSQITQDSDRMVVNSVRQALNNSPTVACININSRNGVVTLNGTVSSEQDRQNIDAIIRSTS